MRILRALAAIIVAAGCSRTENADRRSDTTVTPPVSVDTTAPARNCGVTATPVINDDGIGELKVGRTVSEIESLCNVTGDLEEQGSEGMKERILVTTIGAEVVRSLINDNRIMRVEVSTPHIMTRDSLGVDTPLRRIAERRGARFFPGEGGVYGFVADHCGLSFRFSIPLRPPAGRDWTVDAIAREHGDAAVDRVLITKCTR